MSAFKRGDLVKIPFPYDDPAAEQRRPALVVSNGAAGRGDGLLWVVMVTSADHIAWPGDVPLGARYTHMGLPAPSIVRTAKIAVIEKTRAERIGHIPPEILLVIDQMLLSTLGLRERSRQFR